MSEISRRTLLKGLAASAATAALPDSINRALAIPAHRRTGTIKDVQHIVILTQENRSFDHYFGSLRGVRGFADPRAARLPNGRPVWNQPYAGGELLPFRPAVDDLGLTFLPDPPHGWKDTHAAWNLGRHDQWVSNKGITTMTYHARKDIPFHFALADAFTVCDAYHCSLLGPTDPNRYHLWSGWVGNDGTGGGPVISNAEAGYSWGTFPERLQRAGLSWKIYQDIGTGLNADNGNWWGWTSDPYIGNYGDNSLLYFTQYQNAQPGQPLFDRARTGTQITQYARDPMQLLEDLRQDVRNGTLPQVCWITAPEAYTEHPNSPPNYGAWYTARVLDALTANPEVWSKTVLFVNFDEEGGFFDHVVPPTPAQSPETGASTVSTANEIYPGNAALPAAPYGLGMRVPMLVVSPWSKGGWVNSQLFDHTSLIRFVEARFGDEYPDLTETNITPWRRAVVGDLTSAFDFSLADTGLPKLPATRAYMPTDLSRQPNYSVSAPAQQRMPAQETGVRPARALPYELHAEGSLNRSEGRYRIEFSNTGRAAAVFQVRSANPADLPRSYTVEPGKSLSGDWAVTAAGSTDYDLSVHGPNGFYRRFKGSAAGAPHADIEVRARYEPVAGGITLSLSNRASQRAIVRVVDRYTGVATIHRLQAGDFNARLWPQERSSNWYDLAVTVDGDAGFLIEIAGHMEDGKPGISDPLMGRVRIHGE